MNTELMIVRLLLIIIKHRWPISDLDYNEIETVRAAQEFSNAFEPPQLSSTPENK